MPPPRLRDHAGEATLPVPEGDEELGRVLAELQVRSAQAMPSRAALRAEALQLELARLEREIAQHAGGGPARSCSRRRPRGPRAQVERKVDATLDDRVSEEA